MVKPIDYNPNIIFTSGVFYRKTLSLTSRMAQFVALVLRYNHLFSKVVEIKDVLGLRKLFAEPAVNRLLGKPLTV